LIEAASNISKIEYDQFHDAYRKHQHRDGNGVIVKPISIMYSHGLYPIRAGSAVFVMRVNAVADRISLAMLQNK
jgi:hypothetical protein